MNSLANLVSALSPLTLMVVVIGAIVILFLARESAHAAINSLFRALYRSLRLAAASLRQAANQLRSRNRDVLLHHGQLQVEHDLTKEFAEISSFVQRDLGGYPHIQNQIQQQITLIQDDYERSGQVAAPLPEWVEAVEAVAKLRKQGATTNINTSILEQIHNAAELQHKENLKQIRELSSERHKILRGMTASWRKLVGSVDSTGSSLKEIVRRSERIDTHMQRFNAIVDGTPAAERALFSSALCQFTIAALVTAIAVGGAFFNFHLIALPMSEMVGSLHRVGGIRVADIAALVIICLEVTAGIFLLESLRITRLFPLIGSMDNRMRRLIMAGAAATLIILAGTEAALAFMRDQIAADMASLRASLAGGDNLEGQAGINSWIPLGANMILGFVLPLALTMAAIPLEYLLQTSRSVFGSLLEWCLRFLATAIRMLASMSVQIGKLIIALYDLLIALPIWLEASLKNIRREPNNTSHDEWDTHAASNPIAAPSMTNPITTKE